MKEECISIDDPTSWSNALNGIPHAFSHTWENCYAMHLSTQHNTFLYTFEFNGNRVICPIAERAFDGCVDIVTPYGFSGFVGNRPLPNFPEYWKKFTSERSYTCGYIGLNPLLCDETHFQHDEVHQYSCVYAIDLALGIDEILASMSKNRKRQIKAAQSIDNFIFDRGELLDFLLVHYREFYRKKNASTVYQFAPETIIELANNKNNVILAGTAGKNGVNSVIMFAFTPYSGEYVLNVCVPEGQPYSVALLWYGVQQLKKRNVRWLNLGGGITPGDGVAQFKERFGGKVFPLISLKQIYDYDRYQELCKKVKVNPKNLSGYFPAYRAVNQTFEC